MAVRKIASWTGRSRAVVGAGLLAGVLIPLQASEPVLSPHAPGEFPPPIAVKDAGHWSFQPLRQAAVPRVKNTAWVTNEIDRFVLAGLEKAGLAPAPPADRRTLLRRVTVGLTGLPPTPGEMDDFLRDQSPEAWNRVIDRLLASPAYGERWGRHWLDLVRYADTAGENSDFPVPQAYLYRNYVIDSFNRDVPYDRFIREQIAGDLLPAADEAERNRQIIATGYIAISRRFGSVIKDYPQHLTIEDTLDNLGRTFLGLTLTCARCHDHKYDPIIQEDYYGLYGFFSSTRYAFPGIELDKNPRDFVPLIPQEEADRLEAEYKSARQPLTEELENIRKRKSTADRRHRDAKLTEEERQQARAEADELQKTIRAQEKKLQDFDRQHTPDYPRAYAVRDDAPADAALQIMGEPKKPGRIVARRFPLVLGGMALDSETGKVTSGRLQLAGWIADPANPLTARVMVNRIWQHHFGRGLVSTPSDYGVRGERPTHPELLDWLAARFISENWSVKAMHRLLLTSSAYRMSSEENAAALAADPGNTLLWRQPRRRLDAETLRDTLLMISGQLIAEPPTGPHPFPPVHAWGFTQHHPFRDEYDSNHRSVYLMIPRLKRRVFFATFDGADPNASTPVRTADNTAIQALFMLNDPFLHATAAKLVDRLQREQTDETARLSLLHALALGAELQSDSREAARSYLNAVTAHLGGGEEARRQAWNSYTRAVLQSSAFLYLD